MYIKPQVYGAGDLIHILPARTLSPNGCPLDFIFLDGVARGMGHGGIVDDCWPTAREVRVDPDPHSIRLILPYQGLGTGIPRALHDWPNIELLDEIASNQFKVIIPRSSGAKDKITPQVSDLLAVIWGEQTRMELMEALGLEDRKHFRMAYLQPALDAGLLASPHP